MSKEKPKFVRKDWHKKIKLGSKVKKNRKWRAAVGIHNKIRLGVKGHSKRPKIGYSKSNPRRIIYVNNLNDLRLVEKDNEIIIAKIGKKKRESIIEEANKMKIKILNKYSKREK